MFSKPRFCPALLAAAMTLLTKWWLNSSDVQDSLPTSLLLCHYKHQQRYPDHHSDSSHSNRNTREKIISSNYWSKTEKIKMWWIETENYDVVILGQLWSTSSNQLTRLQINRDVVVCGDRKSWHCDPRTIMTERNASSLPDMPYSEKLWISGKIISTWYLWTRGEMINSTRNQSLLESPCLTCPMQTLRYSLLTFSILYPVSSLKMF